MRRKIQESSSPFDQLSSSLSFRWTMWLSVPVKMLSAHIWLLCPLLLWSGAERRCPGSLHLNATCWSSCWWLLQVYMELKTHSLGREKTAAGQGSPHVSTGRLVSSSGTVYSSTPVHSFKIVDWFFFLLFCVVCFFYVFLRYSSS